MQAQYNFDAPKFNAPNRKPTQPKLGIRQPQFQIIENAQTGALTGRIYVPAQRAATSGYKRWKQSVQVTSIKVYGDGSERLYFKASIEEYERLAAKYPHSANVRWMRESKLADRTRGGELAIIRIEYTRQFEQIADPWEGEVAIAPVPATPPVSQVIALLPPAKDLKGMTKKELAKLAKDKRIKGYSRMTVKQLRDALSA
jgi:hypothetical protein